MRGDRSLLRRRAVEYLIHSAEELGVTPIVKYAALTLFADRFFPAVSVRKEGTGTGNWLLQPIRESNLQLFALVSIWISSKIHNSHPLSVKALKSLGDKTIKEQHFTTRDFVEAEVVLMQALNFEIGTSKIAIIFLEELFLMFKEVAKVGELLTFEVCMDIMDLLYEKDISNLFSFPTTLAASILVVSYLISVPKQKWEFPVLPWVRFITAGEEDEILTMSHSILEHIYEPRYV